jgi:outer membrane protein assembly factor BamB
MKSNQKIMILKRFFSSAIICSCLFIVKGQTTYWRGPQANGIYPEKGLLNEWPANGPEMVWHIDYLGIGFSSPAFAHHKIYCSAMEGETGYIYQMDMNGKLQWKKEYGPEYVESYEGARSTPCIAGDKLYMYSGYGVVTCMSAKDGSMLWQKDTQKELDGRNIRWGVTETLVVDGDVIYCTPGGLKHNVVALNRHNGELIWSSKGVGEKSAYCTPLLVDLPARKLLVTMTESHIIGIDRKDGKLLWSYEQPNKYSVHANTPVYHDGGLFCMSGYGKGSVKLNLSKDGSSVSKAWFTDKLDGRMGGAVYIDGFIYASGDKGRAWQAIDWKDGSQMYASTDLFKGAVIAADELLFCYTEKGELAVVKADPSGFGILTQTKIELGSGQQWAHPVIHDGKLYVRRGKALMAFKIN